MAGNTNLTMMFHVLLTNVTSERACVETDYWRWLYPAAVQIKKPSFSPVWQSLNLRDTYTIPDTALIPVTPE